jgi:hypothetical protein
LGFLLTFIVGLEILQLLLRIQEKSFLLKVFTLLSALFIVFFAGFIYSNHVSSILARFGVALYPFIAGNRVLLTRVIFFFSTMILVLGLYRHVYSMLGAGLRLFAGSGKRVLAGFFSVFLLFTGGLAYLLWFSFTPSGAVPEAPSTTTIKTPTTTQAPTTSTVSTTSTSTTTSTMPAIACSTNRDCGNQTHTKICYKNNVYVQQVTPLCQKPGTPEARCVYKTSLLGESITTEAIPHERCSRGCRNGECITRT